MWRHEPTRARNVITGAYGDAIIYSLYDLADKPYIKLDDINPNAAVFREGKRDLVEQAIRESGGRRATQ